MTNTPIIYILITMLLNEKYFYEYIFLLVFYNKLWNYTHRLGRNQRKMYVKCKKIDNYELDT